MWEATKIPLFNWSCDHPCYFPVRHGIRTPVPAARLRVSRPCALQYPSSEAERGRLRGASGHPAARACLPVHRCRRPAATAASCSPRAGPTPTRSRRPGAATATICNRSCLPPPRNCSPRSTADFLPVLQRIAEPFGLFLDGNSRLALLLMREIDGYIRFKRANLVMQTRPALPGRCVRHRMGPHRLRTTPRLGFSAR